MEATLKTWYPFQISSLRFTIGQYDHLLDPATPLT